MPSPRLFVSSTCYDLKEIRNQLRKFIDDFGFEPVMSDFGDIFYNYEKHIQDSCKDEIEKCQLFILIIGNNYGSFYHNQENNTEIPDSVTLQEFKKAIDVNIFKHVFINKYVEYDYFNFKKLKSKYLQKAFSGAINFDEQEIKSTELTFNYEFNYSEESYKFIFPFLDIVYSLKTGNSVLPFETFDEIKYNLKKQWSSFMYESLTRKSTVPVQLVNVVNEKLDRIETQLKGIFDSKIENLDSDILSLNMKTLSNTIKVTDFEELKSNIYLYLNNILYANYGDNRIIFDAKITLSLFNKFIDVAKECLEKYKWAQNVSLVDLFKVKGLYYRYYKNRMDIPYKSVLDFTSTINSLKERITVDEYKMLCEALIIEMNKLYEQKVSTLDDDDLPF